MILYLLFLVFLTTKISKKIKMRISATCRIVEVLPLSLAWTLDFQTVREMILPRHARLIHWKMLWTEH